MKSYLVVRNSLFFLALFLGTMSINLSYGYFGGGSGSPQTESQKVSEIVQLIKSNHLEEAIIEINKDPQVLDQTFNGKKLVHIAVLMDKPEILGFLISSTLAHQFDLLTQDLDNPFHLAARTHASDSTLGIMVDTFSLFDYLSQKNRRGKTPVEDAIESLNLRFVRFFLGKLGTSLSCINVPAETSDHSNQRPESPPILATLQTLNEEIDSAVPSSPAPALIGMIDRLTGNFLRFGAPAHPMINEEAMINQEDPEAEPVENESTSTAAISEIHSGRGKKRSWNWTHNAGHALGSQFYQRGNSAEATDIAGTPVTTESAPVLIESERESEENRHKKRYKQIKERLAKSEIRLEDIVDEATLKFLKGCKISRYYVPEFPTTCHIPTCTEPKKLYYSRDDWARHMTSEHKNRRYVCGSSGCNFGASMPIRLKEHYVRCHAQEDGCSDN